MRIFNIQIASFNQKNPTVNQNAVGVSHIQLKSLDRDIVTFGAAKGVAGSIPHVSSDPALTHKLLNDIKNIPDLPCVYCGEPMLASIDKQRIEAKLINAKGDELIDALNENQKYFRGVKKNIVDNVIKMARKNPDDDMSAIFIKLAPQYKAELEAEQLDVLRRLDLLFSKSFTSKEEEKIFQSILYETNQWINNENESEPFKRKTFLYELEQLLTLPIFRNQQTMKKIMLEAEKMPQSIESENAFIVKYHRRSNREIVQSLLYDAISTYEHIRPQDKQGPTIPENLAIACARCNNYVRNNTPMPKFVDAHPEIHTNIRKNLDAILNTGGDINKARRNKLKTNISKSESYLRYLQSLENNTGYKSYVHAIAQTYMTESKGRLHLEDY